MMSSDVRHSKALFILATALVSTDTTDNRAHLTNRSMISILRTAAGSGRSRGRGLVGGIDTEYGRGRSACHFRQQDSGRASLSDDHLLSAGLPNCQPARSSGATYESVTKAHRAPEMDSRDPGLVP
jgi:hypothetical protein